MYVVQSVNNVQMNVVCFRIIIAQHVQIHAGNVLVNVKTWLICKRLKIIYFEVRNS